MKAKHSVRVLTEDDDDEKSKKSHFLLTINSNKVVGSMKDPYVSKFKKRLNLVLQDIPEYVKITTGYLPDPALEVEIRPYLEIGERQKRLHAHCSVLIKHDTNLQLDCKKISEAFGGNVYVNSTYVRGNKDYEKALIYIRKNS